MRNSFFNTANTLKTVVLATALCACCSVSFAADAVKAAPVKGATYDWEITNKKFDQFTDLGNYVIDCVPHTSFNFDKALAFANARYDKVIPSLGGGCSALATKTDNGDVIIGRNLDLTVSQLPCYITHLKYGKYETINFTYDELGPQDLTYANVLAKGKLDEEYFNALPLLAADSMNSEGLYIEYNMRAYESDLICYGTNPKAKTRICTISLPFVITSNCATVDEALKFMKEELDIYTMLDKSVASGWNLCFVIGDATGKYGLIEIANDQIKFLPQQHGQGNYYIYPAFNAISREQSGYGRLQFGLERIDQIQSEEDMAKMMENIMWRNEILNIPYACRDENGCIQFYADAKHTIPSLDWRSDNVHMLPVNKFGRYVDVNDNTDEAKLVRNLKKCYNNYRAGINMDVNAAGAREYQEYLNRCDLVWAHSDCNFEDLQKGLIQYYKETGITDMLNKYYAGDEKPLRDNSNVWTTSLSFSVNCTQKRLNLKFWEHKNTVMHYQW